MHGRYNKYLNFLQIEILRVRCVCCRKTHSIIPSFSFPGRSISMDDAEKYFKMIGQNIPVYKAGKEIFPRWNETKYIYTFTDAFNNTIVKGKAIFPLSGDHELTGLDWISSVVGEGEKLIFRFNQYCLSQGVNCIFSTRTRFLWIRNNSALNCFSHKNVTINNNTVVINSS